MAIFAILTDQNIVEQVIIADTEVIQTYSGIWIETTEEVPAGIGHGFDGTSFLPSPYDGAEWDGAAWQPSLAMQLEAALLMIDVLQEVIDAEAT